MHINKTNYIILMLTIFESLPRTTKKTLKVAYLCGLFCVQNTNASALKSSLVDKVAEKPVAAATLLAQAFSIP